MRKFFFDKKEFDTSIAGVILQKMSTNKTILRANARKLKIFKN